MNNWVDAVFHLAAQGVVGFGSNLLDCQGLWLVVLCCLVLLHWHLV